MIVVTWDPERNQSVSSFGATVVTHIPLLILHAKVRRIKVCLFQRGITEREVRLEDQNIIPVQLTKGGAYDRRVLFPDIQVLQGTWELKR